MERGFPETSFENGADWLASYHMKDSEITVYSIDNKANKSLVVNSHSFLHALISPPLLQNVL